MKAEADRHFLQGINQLIGRLALQPGQHSLSRMAFLRSGAFNDKNPWWIVMPD
jgi:hypothetical protein